jgi:fatty-acyl-CoA synthase
MAQLMTMPSIYDQGLDRNQANYQPLTPITFLERASKVFPHHLAIIYGNSQYTYKQFYRRCLQFASVLSANGICRGHTVSVMLANTPAMLEAHYAVPMCGAVLHSINTRLDAGVIAFQLDHSESQVLITDIGFSRTVKSAINMAASSPWIIDYEDTQSPQLGVRFGIHDYEVLVLD